MSILSACQFATDSGAAHIAVMGLRMGATLALAVSHRCPSLQTLVLWDPCEDPSAYIRGQRVLHKLSVPSQSYSDGSAEIPGLSLSKQTLGSLRSMKPTEFAWRHDAGARDDPDVLLMTREGEPESSILRDRPGVQRVRIVGQEQFLEVPSFDAVAPRGSMSRIVRFLDERMSEEAAPLSLKPVVETVVGLTADGRFIREHVEADHDDGIFRIITEPPGEVARELICVNAAAEHHIGPARLWVTLARSLAGVGIRTTRFDRRGVGDTRPGAGQESPQIYSQSAIDDIVKVLGDVPQTAPRLVVGLCSGAWLAGRAVAECPVDDLVLINNGIWQRDFPGWAVGELEVRQAAQAVDRGAPTPNVSARRQRSALVRSLKSRIPYLAWLLLGMANKVQVPEVLLGDLDHRVVRLLLIFCNEDADAFERQRGLAGLRRLKRRGLRVDVRQIAAADHGLFARGGRDGVQTAIAEYIAAATPIELAR